MSRISVIIPTFNRLNLLRFTLNNVLNQSRKPDEVIVVDDHSTDGTFDFVSEHYAEIVRVVKTNGKGPGAARNTGFSLSTGDYIKFFDSDDIMSLNSMEVQERLLEKSKRGFIYSPFLFARQSTDGKWTATENVILNYHPFDESRSILHWMLRGLFLAIPGMLFKREVLEKVGPWSEHTAAYEDWEYLWRIGLIEPYPAHTNETIFLYRQHGSQTTQGNSNNTQRDQEAIYNFESILYSEYFNHTGNADRRYLKAKIYQILKNSPAQNFELRSDTKFNRLVYDFFLLFLRIKNKLARLRTGSNWASFSGPEQSLETIRHNLDYFNSIHGKENS